MTLRAKRLLAVVGAILVVAVGVFVFLKVTGKEVSLGGLFGKKAAEPCPLTQLPAPKGEAPDRPALVVKVENPSIVRPQAGLQAADVVYEEPVEGGITRFIAIYQCRDAKRIGPIRSARLVDADIMRQFGQTVFAYAGGVPPVISAVEGQAAATVSLLDDHDRWVDPSRSAPHDLFASSMDLYALAAVGGSAPEAPFTFDAKAPAAPAAKPARRVGLPFSGESDVRWRWAKKKGVWLRSHGETPHTLENGEQVSADNVVVQVVEVRPSKILDAAGNPSPEVTAIGTGVAYVFRDGMVIEGTWVRESAEDLTRFLDASGAEIPLKPGRTWFELYPSDREVELA